MTARVSTKSTGSLGLIIRQIRTERQVLYVYFETIFISNYSSCFSPEGHLIEDEINAAKY